jgi:hypothetical protein
LILVGGCLLVMMAGFMLSLSGCGGSSSETSSVTPTQQDEETRKQMMEYEKSKAGKKK